MSEIAIKPIAKKPVIKNKYDGLKYNQLEMNFQPSRTIPDQSMSVTEIMARYAKGMPLGGEREKVYYEDNNDLDMTGMDAVDRAAFIQEKEVEFIEIAKKQRAKRTPKKDTSVIEDISTADEQTQNPNP